MEFSTVFGNILHGEPVQKVGVHGIWGWLAKWIQSCYDNRRQKVMVEVAFVIGSCDVPLGSVL